MNMGNSGRLILLPWPGVIVRSDMPLKFAGVLVATGFREHNFT